jgi:hypothetical protein
MITSLTVTLQAARKTDSEYESNRFLKSRQVYPIQSYCKIFIIFVFLN